MSEDRCHKVDGEWIPGCWARVLDPTACHCEPRRGSNRDLAARVDELERRLAILSRAVLKLEHPETDFSGIPIAGLEG